MFLDNLSIQGPSLLENLSLFVDATFNHPPSGDVRIASPILAIGENHGTTEVPIIVGKFAEVILRKKGRLLLLIEFELGERDAIGKFMTNPSLDPDLLLTRDFWRSEGYYGITSESMFDLLCHLRKLKLEGASLSVVPFDGRPYYARADVLHIEDPLAYPMQEILESSPQDCPVLIYAGANHVRTRGTNGKESACSLLRQRLGRDMKSLEVRARAGGEAWGTVGPEGGPWECKPYGMSSYPSLKKAYAIDSLPAEESFDYSLAIERFSPSPRAVAPKS